MLEDVHRLKSSLWGKWISQYISRTGRGQDLNEFKSNSYSYSVLTFCRQNSSKVYIGLVNLMLLLLGPLCVHILWFISIEHVMDA
jgi:hypothetical protein